MISKKKIKSTDEFCLHGTNSQGQIKSEAQCGNPSKREGMMEFDVTHSKNELLHILFNIS